MKTLLEGVEIFPKPSKSSGFIKNWFVGNRSRTFFLPELKVVSEFRKAFSKLSADETQIEDAKRYFRIFKSSPKRFYPLNFERLEYSRNPESKSLVLDFTVSNGKRGGIISLEKRPFDIPMSDLFLIEDALFDMRFGSKGLDFPANYGALEKAIDRQFFLEDARSFAYRPEPMEKIARILGSVFEKELILQGQFENHGVLIEINESGVRASRMMVRPLNSNAVYSADAKVELLKTFESFGLYTDDFYDSASKELRQEDGKLVAFYDEKTGEFDLDKFNLPQIVSRRLMFKFDNVLFKQMLEIQDKIIAGLPKTKQIIPSAPICLAIPVSETSVDFCIGITLTPDYGSYGNAVNIPSMQSGFLEESAAIEKFALSI